MAKVLGYYRTGKVTYDAVEMDLIDFNAGQVAEPGRWSLDEPPEGSIINDRRPQPIPVGAPVGDIVSRIIAMQDGRG